jgi:hypothetical protein
MPVKQKKFYGLLLGVFMVSLKELDKLFIELESKNDKIRFPAFKKIHEMTNKKVKWIYDKWFVLIEKTNSENSFQRSIGLTLLANLAKSDTENRFEKIIDDYLKHFDDEKFITARLCIQNVWKIAVANKKLLKKIIGKLESSYSENSHLNTHANLIKQDIIGSLAKISILGKNKNAAELIESFIENENDIKFQKALHGVVEKQKE